GPRVARAGGELARRRTGHHRRPYGEGRGTGCGSRASTAGSGSPLRVQVRRAEGRRMRRLALAPFFMVGLLAGVWLVVAPWIVGFPPGAQGGWGASRWSYVLAGA